MSIFEKMGYKAKYDKREKFFEVNVEEYPEKHCKIWCNVLVNYGAVEFVWVVYHNNKVRFGIPRINYSHQLINVDYIIPIPRYRSYEEMEEIFKEEFALFDDFKQRILKEYE